MKTRGNTILMTGGGSGIGEALAHHFHDLGNTVIVAGSRAEALANAVEGQANMHALTLDIEDADAIETFARRAVAEHPSLKVCDASEVLVERVGLLRFAEAKGTFDQVLSWVNELAAKARAYQS